MPAANRPDYGIDAPTVIRNLALLGVAGFLAGTGLLIVPKPNAVAQYAPAFFAIGASFVVTAGLMLAYSRYGKYRHRDRLLAMHQWRGDERVLDVGTGRGLLAVGAAKQAPRGRVVGIDIWNSADLFRNHEESTRANLELEGVQARVEIHHMDATRLTFDDDTFDVVVSNLCLHNIDGPEERAQACRQIARVLKPGGVALISDFQKTSEYASVFQEERLRVARTAPFWWDTFPPLRVVEARKPFPTPKPK